ncbi:M48 family metalloprotease [Roseobacter litoralis]|uniref:M48 family metalloprotease n=1 Tax=Roseobacter litoralis TaxID=42443 RepID=UPI000160E2E8|nr:M48 family metalloprotease [Roseobacter litoralis]
MIGHEYAHIKNGDAKFFHFVGIFGITTFFIVVYSLIATFVLLSNVLSGVAAETSFNGTITAILGLIGFPVFFLLWIRQSLHAREFRADRESRALNREAVDDWMRRSLRREIRNNTWWFSGLDRMVGSFTHPSFKRRADALRDDRLASNYRLHSEVLRSLVFVTGGAALSYFVFMALNSFASQAESFPVWFVPIFILLIVLPICAAYGAISVSAMYSFEQGGWRASLGFCTAVAVANWLLLATAFYVIVFLGQFDAITEGVPSAPPELMSTGVWPFFVMLINFGVVLSVLTMLAFKLLGRFRYSLIVHLIVGPGSLIGGLLATKLEWWLLT